MVVNGLIRMGIDMNVIEIETDAIGIDRNGQIVITNPDKFFMDWVDEWSSGNGELLGASEIDVNLEKDTD